MGDIKPLSAEEEAKARRICGLDMPPEFQERVWITLDAARAAAEEKLSMAESDARLTRAEFAEQRLNRESAEAKLASLHAELARCQANEQKLFESWLSPRREPLPVLRDVLALGWDAVMGTGGPHFSEESRERVSFALRALETMLVRLGGQRLANLEEAEAARERVRPWLDRGETP